ncbi:hypothetical protein Pme01_42620 [Planosporangium mesophilum]|uniref:Uncharacterized protein n=1 Tax=Planosporangium mesophilum TaxID=689768 RepID=A0A8J3X1P4_9ACTN|nr:hypothetical protein Pme01_42620 [Planosporangium mesophilum]
MSVLKPGDEDLHYSDGSHRWMCPDLRRDEDVWSERVKDHMRAHGYRRDSPSRLIITPARRQETEHG